MGAPRAALRMAVSKAGPVVTDNGNFVIDAPFAPDTMADPAALLRRIKMLTGVVEVGLFCGMAQAAYFGNEVRRGVANLMSRADGGSRTARWTSSRGTGARSGSRTATAIGSTRR
jgi:hypothetical protein